MTPFLSVSDQRPDGAISSPTASAKSSPTPLLWGRKWGGSLSKCQRAQTDSKTLKWKHSHLLRWAGKLPICNPRDMHPTPALDPAPCVPAPTYPYRKHCDCSSVGLVNTRWKPFLLVSLVLWVWRGLGGLESPTCRFLDPLHGPWMFSASCYWLQLPGSSRILAFLTHILLGPLTLLSNWSDPHCTNLRASRFQPLQRMRSCILDAHKELFWSHAIQESRPGQGLEHQVITLSQEKADPIVLAPPGKLDHFPGPCSICKSDTTEV